MTRPLAFYLPTPLIFKLFWTLLIQVSLAWAPRSSCTLNIYRCLNGEQYAKRMHKLIRYISCYNEFNSRGVYECFIPSFLHSTCNAAKYPNRKWFTQCSWHHAPPPKYITNVQGFQSGGAYHALGLLLNLFYVIHFTREKLMFIKFISAMLLTNHQIIYNLDMLTPIYHAAQITVNLLF